MSNVVRGALITGLAFVIFVVPFVCFRAAYSYEKRLREVDSGRVYRSGQMTADGLADAVHRFGICTVINVQDDVPDPDVEKSFWRSGTVKESTLCRMLGVHYVWIAPDLVPVKDSPRRRPQAVDELLRVLDDQTVYPVLIHCRAGLNRTGCVVAIYRMEYQGWSPMEAFREMKDLGFGNSTCTASNQYVNQYVLAYRRGLRSEVRSQRSEMRSQKSGVQPAPTDF
jgi:tyrosine-protein phosphatase SIW14